MDNTEKAAEPPSCLQPPIFMIGQDSKGNWVAQERNGVCGGLFVDRAGALKFAKSESGKYPHAVVWVSGVLELDISRALAIAAEQRSADRVGDQRRTA